jgi:hypothetical protein
LLALHGRVSQEEIAYVVRDDWQIGASFYLNRKLPKLPKIWKKYRVRPLGV